MFTIILIHEITLEVINISCFFLVFLSEQVVVTVKAFESYSGDYLLETLRVAECHD
jgi:hypothetical protein